MPTPIVTFKLSSAQRQTILDSSWVTENPNGALDVQIAPSKKVGSGYSYTITMSRLDANDLIDYLRSLATAVAAMTAHARDGRRDHLLAIRAVDRISEALAYV